MEAEKVSIQRRKKCVVKNMCVDGKGNNMRRSKTLPEGTIPEETIPEETKVVKKIKKGEAETKSVNGHGLSPFNEVPFFFLLGEFILSGDNKNLPKINMISVDKTADTYWQPQVKSVRGGIKTHYADEVLFVRGLYSPFHLSH